MKNPDHMGLPKLPSNVPDVEDDPEAIIAKVRAMIARGEDPSDDEMRLVVLAGRAGRHTTTATRKASRSAPKEPPDIFQIFKKAE